MDVSSFSPTVPAGALSRRRALARLGAGRLALAGLTAASGVAAQEATPEPRQGCAPRLGDTTVVAAADGQALGEIVVEDFIEPFTEFDPNFAPPRGTHLVGIRTTFRATGQQAMGVNPGASFLQYSDGFITYPTGLRREPEPLVPDLSNAPVEPGKSSSGLVGFTVLNGVEVVRIFYFPQGDRLFLVAELC